VSSNVSVRLLDPTADEDTIREECRAIYRFLVALHAEAGFPAHIAQPNYGKAMQGIYDAIKDGVVLLAEKDGEIVGSFGGHIFPIWYADQDIIGERWFYVKPEHRTGEVLKPLLAELYALSEDLQVPVSITIANFHRNRAPNARLTKTGEALTYFPTGSSYVIAPARDAA
jgi:hypothetical protein